jgi:hypothetical protein
MNVVNKITRKTLEKINACESGIRWMEKQGTNDVKKLFDLAIVAGNFQDVNIVLTRMMNKKQKVTYAIFAAESVIDIYEKKYPNDDRPRKAIISAKAYLKNPCAKTKKADAAADAAAAYAAADAAAAAAAAAAAYAADAADAAYAAYAKKEMFIKILTFGFELIFGK